MVERMKRSYHIDWFPEDGAQYPVRVFLYTDEVMVTLDTSGDSLPVSYTLLLGGAIVDSGKFDRMAHAEKYPGLCTPDDSYHGITYAEKFGKEGAFITKCTAQLLSLIHIYM